MPDVGKVAATPRREAPVYLAKAEQFLGTARDALDESHHDSALLAAIHAAISSADAVCVIMLGARSTDPDHQRAADLLESTGTDASTTRSRQLRSLLKKKNLVEYEARRASPTEARDGIERASRLVEWASELLRRANR
jgi:HEPN domain-containing protein